MIFNGRPRVPKECHRLPLQFMFEEKPHENKIFSFFQNDHGGPLVTWVGSHEVLIGVASVFKVDNDYKCVGPYLYTSTQCNGAFLSCILESNNNIQNHERTGKYR